MKWFKDKKRKGGGRWGIYVLTQFQWDRRDPNNISQRKYMYFKHWEAHAKKYGHPDWEAHAQREISERTDQLDDNDLIAWIHDYAAFG